MSVDAVLLLRVNSKALLRDRMERLGLPVSCLRPLDDGSALLSSMVAFGATATDPFDLRAFLRTAFGDDLSLIHDDPRGVFVFPDAIEPSAQSYDAVIDAVGAAGLWVPAEPLSPAEMLTRLSKLEAEVDAYVAEHGNRVDSTPSSDRPETEPPRSIPGVTAAPRAVTDLGSLDKMVADLMQRVGGEMVLACVLVAGRALPSPLPHASAVHTLADGSHVIETTSLITGTEMIALSLGGEWSAWLEGHDDPRGVLVFPHHALAEVLVAESYASATERAGAEASWVRPKTIEELIAEHRARAQSFLDEDDD